MSIQQRGLLTALGVPLPPDCESGICIITNLTGSAAPLLVDPIVPVLPWLDFAKLALHGKKVHGGFQYGNYCGPGGRGMPQNGIDAACAAHDVCYDLAGISADAQNNKVFKTLSQAQKDAMGACNQQLCASLGDFHPSNPSQWTAKWDIEQYFRKHSKAPCTK